VAKHVWDAWEQLLYAVQTGELPFDRIFGKPFYNHLEDHPDRSLNGVLFDLPAVIARARNDRHVTTPRLARRCAFESGDFFESVPDGGDAYILKYILHNWADENCVRILTNCRRAMNETAFFGFTVSTLSIVAGAQGL